MRRRVFLGTVGSAVVAGCSSGSSGDTTAPSPDTTDGGTASGDTTRTTEPGDATPGTEPSGEPAFERAWELDPRSGEVLSSVDVRGGFVDGTGSHVFVGDTATETGSVCYRY